MHSLSRIAIAAALTAGFGSIAQAQTRWAQPAASDYYGVVEAQGVAADRVVPQSAPVPASESGTVMGLRVPR